MLIERAAFVLSFFPARTWGMSQGARVFVFLGEWRHELFTSLTLNPYTRARTHTPPLCTPPPPFNFKGTTRYPTSARPTFLTTTSTTQSLLPRKKRP